jgi:hypothetical protein
MPKNGCYPVVRSLSNLALATIYHFMAEETLNEADRKFRNAAQCELVRRGVMVCDPSYAFPRIDTTKFTEDDREAIECCYTEYPTAEQDFVSMFGLTSTWQDAAHDTK